MTPGIPGAGVGGLFYLLSALWMPFREAWRVIGGRSSPERRRIVKQQVSIAVAILVSMGGTAWLLAFVVTMHPAIAYLHRASVPTAVRSDLPRLLSYSALALTSATLALILASVSLLRRIVRPGNAGPVLVHSPVLGSPSKQALSCARRTILTLTLILLPTSLQAAQTSQGAVTVAQHLERADAAFLDEDSATAEEEYRGVLNVDPLNSRATFRLGQLLQRRHRNESERLFRSYIRLEPGDPWGYIALAEFLGRQGRYNEALKLSAEALRRAPQERDAALVQARLLARSGRTDRAIQAYEDWLGNHPGDVEVSRELASQYQRAGRTGSARSALERAAGNTPDEETAERLRSLARATAPALDPLFSFSRDSDGNTKLRTVLGSDFTVGDGTRLGLSVGRTQISDVEGTRTFNDFAFTTQWRPRAAIAIDVATGAVRTDPVPDARGVQVSGEFIPTARVHARAAAPGNAARIDVRFNRNLVDATPLLLVNHVVRNDLQVRPDFTFLRQFRLRGAGGMSLIQGTGERNQRHMAGAGAGWAPVPSTEFSANFTQSGFAHASGAGYFAPKRIQAADAGTYMEFEREAILVALDLGGGLERFEEHDSAFGRWRPALRAYALVSLRLRPGRELHLELDSYNSQAGPILAPASGWKYASVVASFRWALR